jgi:hypothetical protein
MESITQTQRDHAAEALECYLSRRKRPENDGTFAHDVVIGPSGAVLEVATDEPSVRLVGTGVPECVADAVQTWRFPKSKTWTRARLEWIVAADAERAEVLRQSEAAVALAATSRPAILSPMDRALEQQAGILQRCVPLSDGGASVAVSLKVTDDGGVARVDGEPPDALARCIEAEVILWALPPARPGEVSRVVREFVFAPGVIAVRPFASTRGGFDKDVIMKVIKANQSQIRFCSEVALQEKRSLAGKVAVAWTIAPDGFVQSATVTDDTMGDPRVAECVVARVLRWSFPEPVGGGIVNVTFPWLFKPAGDP